MSYAAERQAIEGRFAANWAATPIAWDNVDFTPPEAPWAHLHIVNGDAYQASMGSPVLVRHPGVIQVEILAPAGTGSGTAMALVDQACAIFRFALFDGIVCRAPTKHRLMDREGWSATLVEVPFQRDTFF
jgi:hypothetical protein